MCYGLNIYYNNISINSSYFFSILKQFQYAQALNIYSHLPQKCYGYNITLIGLYERCLTR